MTHLPPFLQSLFSSPIQFATALPFSEEDKRTMPWLAHAIREYNPGDELGKGGRSIAFRGLVWTHESEYHPKVEVVLKVPNIDEKYPVRDIKKYLLRLQDEGSREWQLTRERLRGCRFANAIFDFTVLQRVHLNELLPIPITAQLYLHDAISLDEYLLKTHQRAEPYKSRRGRPVDNWNGMSDPSKWLKLATSVAVGLADKAIAPLLLTAEL